MTGATLDPSDGVLKHYFNELKGIPLLDAKQEISLAREIERLEIEHWCALFSYAPALGTLLAALEPVLSGHARLLETLRRLVRSPRAQRQGARSGKPDPNLQPAVKAAVKQLRKLDPTRSGLHAADSAIRATFTSDAGARDYLTRVARARDAEQRAKSRFVGANLRLVISMTRRYHRSLLPLEDLVQEGNLGLMRAVERFDYRRGYRFSTYATWWIRHGLNRAVSDKARLVRIPVHALDELSRVARATEHVRARTGTTPNARELATETGIHESKLTRLKMENPLQPPISLDQDISAEREQTLHEILPAREQPDLVQSLDLSSWRQQLERLLCQLRPMEAEVLRFRFGLDGGEELTLREIGQKYSLSRERIRQVQAEALAKLRKAVGPGFDDFENARAA